MRKLLVVVCVLLLLPWMGLAQKVTIGSKQFPESEILGEIIIRLLSNTGVKAEHKKQMGGTKILWEALIRGDIDAYPEYTGTLKKEIFSAKNIGTDEQLASELEKTGLQMTKSLGYNNTYALGMKEQDAQKLGIKTITDMAKHPELRLGLSNEFMSRADGWPGLKTKYSLNQGDVRGLKHELAYAGLNSGKIDVTDLYSTDAEIAKYHLRVLQDDQNYFPRYDAIIVYRKEVDPKAVAAFKTLEGKIDEQKMVGLNSAVVVDGKSAAATAQDFVNKQFSGNATVTEETLTQRIIRHGLQHLKLVGISLLAAILIAVPLGILAARNRYVAQFVLGIVGVIQTIPSLALLVFFIPLMGIGETPAIVALFLYSLLPIVRNTYAGLHDIPSPIRESAEALGLTSAQRLQLVYMPMASRTILAGIKTSAVINVGTATLGALIGAGGFGEPIITGLTLNNTSLVLEGAIPAAVLALLVQWLFDLSELIFVPKGLRLKPASA